jgi:hypothetical protein
LGKFALRTIFLAPAIFIAAATSATADPPFMPISRQPDHVVTMVERQYGNELAKRNVTHRGDWTRVDRIEGTYRSAVSYSANGVVGVHDYRSASLATFTRGGSDLSYRDHRPRNTGERRAHLGETCTVWEVSRPSQDTPRDSGLFHLSCVTDDGIELWQRSLYGSKLITSAEATRVERRPVTVDEVKPSRSLLMLDWWDQDPPTSGASPVPGSETIMERSGQSPDAGKSVRTTRQRGPWQSMEETVGGVRRRLEIAHDSKWMSLEYIWDESGAPKRLTITRPASTPEDAAVPASAMWNDLNRSETILGETCRWFSLLTMGDVGRSRCLTSDGVMLKDHWRWRGWEGPEVVHEWTAVRVTRRPVDLSEIKPSAELLDPHVWVE